MEERGSVHPPVICLRSFFQVLVEKSYGCNHVSGSVIQDPERVLTIVSFANLKMTCTRCQQVFCYRCGKRLDNDDTILHYQVGNDCSGALYD